VVPNVYIYSTDGLDIITDFNYGDNDRVISIDPTTNSRIYVDKIHMCLLAKI
jgi:hypothetical protein